MKVWARVSIRNYFRRGGKRKGRGVMRRSRKRWGVFGQAARERGRERLGQDCPRSKALMSDVNKADEHFHGGLIAPGNAYIWIWIGKIFDGVVESATDDKT